jgi:hypothetical protein
MGGAYDGECEKYKGPHIFGGETSSKAEFWRAMGEKHADRHKDTTVGPDLDILGPQAISSFRGPITMWEK